MRLIDRYIGRQVLFTAVFAISILTVVLVLGNVFKRLLDLLVNQNAPLSLILSFVGYVVPFSLTFTIPWGVLTAVLLVFGRLSADSELTAMRVTGISVQRACLSVWMVAAAFTGICLWINLDVAPRAQQEMKNALFRIATDDPLAMFGNDKVIDFFPGRKIYVEKSEGKRLTNLLVYELDENKTIKNVTYARRGSIGMQTVPVKQQDGSMVDEKRIILTLTDGRYEQRDEAHPEDLSRIAPGITIQEGSIAISLKELYEKRRGNRRISALSVGDLLDSGKPEALVELNMRLSNALATLAFTILAVPLAVTAQRKETAVGFVISLAIALLYYLLLFLANLTRGQASLHPEVIIWLPTLVFLFVGIYRMVRLSRK